MQGGDTEHVCVVAFAEEKAHRMSDDEKFTVPAKSTIVWTDEAIIEEFRKHLAYWQDKLRLRDLDVRVMMLDPDSANAWCAIESDNCGANPHRAILKIRRASLTTGDISRREVWATCAHELIHAMNWVMSAAFEPLVDHFAVAQINMAKSLMRVGNESLAYKWESLLAGWFAADAPAE
jgi:hypothetical protein